MGLLVPDPFEMSLELLHVACKHLLTSIWDHDELLPRNYGNLLTQRDGTPVHHNVEKM